MNTSFAPGGVLGGLGSAYDNDIAARTVIVISKKPNGEDIPLQVSLGTQQKRMDFHGISADGSHVLMETPAGDNFQEAVPNSFARIFPRFLFMRVNDTVSYDISRGFPVVPVGMTRSGNKVFFYTEAQMPGTGDTDNSTDLYMWEENGDKLVLISQGNGNGNDDRMQRDLGSRILRRPALDPERAHPRDNMVTSAPGQDDLFAEDERRHLLLLARSARPGKAGRETGKEPLPLPQRLGASGRDARCRHGNNQSADLAERRARGVPDQIESQSI